MYEYILGVDALTLLSFVIIVPVIGALFEFTIVNVAQYVVYHVQLVRKEKVIDPDSQKGNFNLYTRFLNRVRRNVFKHGDW